MKRAVSYINTSMLEDRSLVTASEAAFAVGAEMMGCSDGVDWGAWRDGRVHMCGGGLGRFWRFGLHTSRLCHFSGCGVNDELIKLALNIVTNNCEGVLMSRFTYQGFKFDLGTTVSIGLEL